MSRAHEKSIRGRNDSKSHKTLQATSVVDDESPSCSYSVWEGNSQVPSDSETSSTSQGSWTASSTTIASSGVFDTNSDQSDESQDEEHSFSSNALSSVNPCSEILAIKLEVLQQYLLYKYKMQQPILKEEMLKIVGEDNQDHFADILQKVSDRMEVVFAVDLKEVDSSNHAYELVSKLNLPNNGRVNVGRGLPKTGLLMNILGLIFIKGNRASEEETWEFLNMMEVYAGRKHHIYGEPRKLINTEFVQLKYLEYRQVPNSDPARYEFLWGPRAHAETSKMQVLEFLAKVNDTVPSAFSPWYEEALQDQERARAIEEARAGTSAPARHDTMAPASPTHSDV
ncbi:PREDICTED: melanoma-associated antigen B5-like [Hipposideros armiger]|uniref:Melanoma-associated antigen B5-like n=1 Tax=Hipposideros armiger TaxID=186990 RepID=A0A8B7QA04_HIPAR|nr:PREDICTED: melanoma-associated antigen B5-like [Hipposideros armiger]